ncbi:DUF2157 domain-containing protein [Lentisphaerota bacterium ZTH]|nr:DUF2157 domain-containing protein [Lentisphaerota bacterium]WET07369.1 DUF2157 domain-containing protein [Lentisphaerota bacterium ZTH]
MASKKSFINWLLGELPDLERNGIIDEENCEKLHAYYSRQIPAGINYQRLMLIIFGALSAVLVMGGVLLLVAHNWQDIPFRIRLSLAFVPLVASLTFGWYTKLDDRNQAWQEASAVLIGGSFAVVVAMVSQIYHTGGMIYEYMFTCLLFTFPLLYIFKGQAYLLLFLIGLTIYNYASLRIDSVAYSWMFLAFVLPYAVYYILKELNSIKMQFICNILIVFIIINFFGFFRDCHAGMFKAGWAVLLPAILFAGKRFEKRGLVLWKNSFLVAGFLGVAAFMTLGSIESFWSGGVSFTSNLSETGLIVFSSLLYLWMLFQMFRLKESSLVIPLILPLAAVAGILFDSEVLVRYLFVLLMVIYGILLIVKSCSRHNMPLLNLGMFLIAVQIIIQFFDSDVPILIRAAGFIVTGIAFLVTNIILSRKFKHVERTGEVLK